MSVATFQCKQAVKAVMQQTMYHIRLQAGSLGFTNGAVRSRDRVGRRFLRTRFNVFSLSATIT